MSLDTQVFEQTDFSGGITDSDTGASPNKYSEADNLLITADRKLESRPGSELDNTAFPLPPVGNIRIGHLINYDSDSDLLVQAGQKFYYRSPTGEYQPILGPTGNLPLLNATTSTVISEAQWNKHILVCSDSGDKPIKLFKDSGTWRCLTAGLPGLATEPTFTATAGDQSFIYGFAYYNTYTISGTTYEDWGPTTIVIRENIANPTTSPVSITDFPQIVNGAGDNYDTANIKIAIFRTINGGTTLFKIGEVVNGFSGAYTDSAADDVVIDNPVLYTTGDVQDNDPPPSNATTCHITNGIAYYVVGNRVYQSVPGDFDSVPAANYREFDETVKGVSSINGLPIFACRRRVWRIDGAIDETGNGDMTPIKISDTAGCISAGSMVTINGGCVWFGVDGIYATNGYTVTRINDDLTERYASWITTEGQKRIVHGDFDRTGNRVYWAIQKDAGSLDADACLVLDLRWGLSSSASFTTISGGEAFAPTAIRFFNGNLYRGDKRGFVLVHHSGALSDPEIDPAKSISQWSARPVYYLFRSTHNNFGTSSTKKYVGRIIVSCKNVTNLSVGVRSINDQNRENAKLIPMRFRGNIIWDDPNVVWGDNSLIWNYDGVIEEKRRFPAGSLRCNYKQIEIAPAEVIMANSDTLGTAGIVAGAILLNGGATWPYNIQGMTIAFEADGYSRPHVIRTRSDDTITVEEPSYLPTGGSLKWQITGVPRDEKIHLMSYVLKYGLISPTHASFTGETGGNSK